MIGTTLITGADGYVGRSTAAQLLTDSDDILVLAVRAGDSRGLEHKRERLTALLGPAWDDARIQLVPWDLCRADSPALNPGTITRIVHSAAVTRFNVDRETARMVNVAGTAKVADFARRCENLQRFALLSTLYAAGRQCGVVTEIRHREPGFVNEYEWSKWAAEQHLLDTCADLPLSVLRLATLIADDDTGKVLQYNAFHNTLKLYYYGLLSLVPGELDTPLVLATASFTTAAISVLLDPAAAGGIVHVCPDPADTATLGQLIETAFDVFDQDDAFRKRRVLRPFACVRESFDDLVQLGEHIRGGPIHESLDSVAPFAHQLYLAKEFRNDALRAAWRDYSAPDARALISATTTYLVESRWGRNQRGNDVPIR